MKKLLFLIIIVFLFSCEKDKPKLPIIATTAVTNITGTTATSGGNITDEGSSTVISHGVCWSTGLTPTIGDNKTNDGAGAGNFSSNITDLNGVTVYYVRAYASNSDGTGYGMAMSFSTLGETPAPSITSATNITVSSATLNGYVNANYLSTIVTFEYGETTSYGNTIIATQSPVTGSSNTHVTVNITNLSIATTYHYRLKSENSIGTTYSNDIMFKTFGQVPAVTTKEAADITINSSYLFGIVNANYLSTSVTFEYGTTSNYGNSVTAAQSPVSGNTNVNVSANISGLSEGTIYHYRVSAVNVLGTTVGNDMEFKTLGQIPSASTIAATSIATTSATLNGSVNANDLNTIVTFEYGTSETYGNTAVATQSPIVGRTNTNVHSTVTSLNGGETYHFRIKAVNSLGTNYGNDMTFDTPVTGIVGTIDDIDGNTYPTIGIGYQTWMAENLKTTKYNDGNEIPNITDNTEWHNLKTPAFCWYNNEVNNANIYGALYNWYAVETGKLCPSGWHVATDEEWTTLTDFYGGEGSAGGILKETGTTHWNSPNTGATNESGFTALPGGYREGVGEFYNLRKVGYWWTSTEETTYFWKLSRIMYYNYSRAPATTAITESAGASVRCIKD